MCTSSFFLLRGPLHPGAEVVFHHVVPIFDRRGARTFRKTGSGACIFVHNGRLMETF